MIRISQIIKAICSLGFFVFAFTSVYAENKFSTIVKHSNGLQVKIPQGCTKRTFEGQVDYFDQAGKGFKICLGSRSGAITILLIPRKALPKKQMQATASCEWGCRFL